MRSYKEEQQRIVQMMSSDSGISTTIIPIKKDHQLDNALCLTSVAFTPIKLADLIYKCIIKPLKTIEPDHYYYSPDSLHVTIKNVKTTSYPPLYSKDDIIKVDHLFSQIIPLHQTLRLSCEEIINFPTSVSLICYSPIQYQKLILDLNEGLNMIGVPDNKKYISDTIFFGNITLCRFTKQPTERFYEKLNSLKNIIHEELIVDSIKLITCNSVCHPGTRKIINTYYLSQIN